MAKCTMHQGRSAAQDGRSCPLSSSLFSQELCRIILCLPVCVLVSACTKDRAHPAILQRWQPRCPSASTPSHSNVFTIMLYACSVCQNMFEVFSCMHTIGCRRRLQTYFGKHYHPCSVMLITWHAYISHAHNVAAGPFHLSGWFLVMWWWSSLARPHVIWCCSRATALWRNQCCRGR